MHWRSGDMAFELLQGELAGRDNMVGHHSERSYLGRRYYSELVLAHIDMS